MLHMTKVIPHLLSNNNNSNNDDDNNNNNTNIKNKYFAFQLMMNIVKWFEHSVLVLLSVDFPHHGF